MKKRKTIHKRMWLSSNDIDSMSHCSYTIDEYDEYAMTVRLADCSRSISYYCEGDKGIRKLNELDRQSMYAWELDQASIDAIAGSEPSAEARDELQKRIDE